MSEIQAAENYEQEVHRLTELSGRFLLAWGQGHTTMKDIGLLPFNPQIYPFQAIDHYKTLSFAARYEIDLDAYKGLLQHNLANSFNDPDKMEVFMHSMAQEYPYPGGNGRNYTQVLAEDFLSQGLSVAAMLGHPEHRLTDSPRFVVNLAHNLAEQYGTQYAQDLGLVAGAPLKVESYKDHPIDDMLSLTSDVYYTMTKSDNAEVYRERAGLTKDDLQEMSTFMNRGFGGVLMRDSRAKIPRKSQPLEHGHVIAFNPTATRAIIVEGSNGQPESITLPSADPNTGRLMSGFGAYWPAVVIGDEIKLGPFIRLEQPPKGEYTREKLKEYYLQRVEDAMDIVASMIGEVLGKAGVAKYIRTMERGKIYKDYFLGGDDEIIDGKALQAASHDR